MKTFEIYGENFSQIINANSMRDAIAIFELHNGQLAIIAEDVAYRKNELNVTKK